MNRWTSYHLLGAVLGPQLAAPERLFAWSVRGVVDGFVAHDDYLRTAQRAAQGRLAPGRVEQRVVQLATLDANPIASLMRSASDAPSFERRWNGFNRLVPLGVSTIVSSAPTLQLRRELRGAQAAGELRAQVTGACVEHLLRNPPNDPDTSTSPLLRNLQLLGLERGSLRDVIEDLLADPGSSLDACATQAGTSRRTLQRELARAGLRFNQLRPAVRLILAGAAIRSGTDTLTGIAQLAGFFDSAHLVHAWRRACGLSPSQYAGLQSPGCDA